MFIYNARKKAKLGVLALKRSTGNDTDLAGCHLDSRFFSPKTALRLGSGVSLGNFLVLSSLAQQCNEKSYCSLPSNSSKMQIPYTIPGTDGASQTKFDIVDLISEHVVLPRWEGLCRLVSFPPRKIHSFPSVNF